MTKRKQNQRDKLIEAEYYRAAAGRQINILDIPKVFDSVNAAMEDGTTLVDAVKAAVEKFTVPIKGA